MFMVITGLIAFALFFLYDLNSITIRNRGLQTFFTIGLLLLCLSTVMLFRTEALRRPFTIPCLICLIAGIFFLGLLIYTLFFALPFDDTYVKENHMRPVYSEGVYALCRHPGVLWFIGFYLCFALYSQSSLVWIYSAVVCAGNLLYILFQDAVIFPQTFTNYDEYRRTTPFLIPNQKSIASCIRTIRK